MILVKTQWAIVTGLIVLGGTMAVPKASDGLTLDFEDLQSNGAGSLDHGGTYSSGGFTLTSAPPSQSARFSTYETGHARFVGSTALREFYANATTTLARDDAAAFALVSIALGELDSSDTSTVKAIEFRGTKPDTTTVTETFDLGSITSGTFDLETFVFSSEFENVVSVEWTQGVGSTGTAFQFDNVTTSAVPEPTPLSLVTLLAFLGTYLRRFRHAGFEV